MVWLCRTPDVRDSPLLPRIKVSPYFPRATPSTTSCVSSRAMFMNPSRQLSVPVRRGERRVAVERVSVNGALYLANLRPACMLTHHGSPLRYSAER